MVAAMNTARGTKLHVLQGNGATPEVYTGFCGINARTFSFKTQTNDVYVPDCNNPDDPAWRQVIKSGRSLSVSGSGILDSNTLTRYMKAYNKNISVSYRLEMNLPGAVGGGHWKCSMMMTELTLTGNDGDLITVSISLESDGAVVWVDNASDTDPDYVDPDAVDNPDDAVGGT